jgi:hypothetical protein
MRSKLPTFNEFIKESKTNESFSFSNFDVDEVATAIADNVNDRALKMAMKDAADEHNIKFKSTGNLEEDLIGLLDEAEIMRGTSFKEKVMKHIIEVAETKDMNGVEAAEEVLGESKTNESFEGFNLDYDSIKHEGNIVEALADNVNDKVLKMAIKDAARFYGFEFKVTGNVETDLYNILDEAENPSVPSDLDGVEFKTQVLEYIIQTAKKKDMNGVEAAADDFNDSKNSNPDKYDKAEKFALRNTRMP